MILIIKDSNKDHIENSHKDYSYILNIYIYIFDDISCEINNTISKHWKHIQYYEEKLLQKQYDKKAKNTVYFCYHDSFFFRSRIPKG